MGAQGSETTDMPARLGVSLPKSMAEASKKSKSRAPRQIPTVENLSEKARNISDAAATLMDFAKARKSTSHGKSSVVSTAEDSTIDQETPSGTFSSHKSFTQSVEHMADLLFQNVEAETDSEGEKWVVKNHTDLRSSLWDLLLAVQNFTRDILQELISLKTDAKEDSRSSEQMETHEQTEETVAHCKSYISAMGTGEPTYLHTLDAVFEIHRNVIDIQDDVIFDHEEIEECETPNLEYDDSELKEAMNFIFTYPDTTDAIIDHVDKVNDYTVRFTQEIVNLLEFDKKTLTENIRREEYLHHMKRFEKLETKRRKEADVDVFLSKDHGMKTKEMMQGAVCPFCNCYNSPLDYMSRSPLDRRYTEQNVMIHGVSVLKGTLHYIADIIKHMTASGQLKDSQIKDLMGDATKKMLQSATLVEHELKAYHEATADQRSIYVMDAGKWRKLTEEDRTRAPVATVSGPGKSLPKLTGTQRWLVDPEAMKESVSEMLHTLAADRRAPSLTVIEEKDEEVAAFPKGKKVIIPKRKKSGTMRRPSSPPEEPLPGKQRRSVKKPAVKGKQRVSEPGQDVQVAEEEGPERAEELKGKEQAPRRSAKKVKDAESPEAVERKKRVSRRTEPRTSAAEDALPEEVTPETVKKRARVHDEKRAAEKKRASRKEIREKVKRKEQPLEEEEGVEPRVPGISMPAKGAEEPSIGEERKAKESHVTSAEGKPAESPEPSYSSSGTESVLESSSEYETPWAEDEGEEVEKEKEEEVTDLTESDHVLIERMKAEMRQEMKDVRKVTEVRDDHLSGLSESDHMLVERLREEMKEEMRVARETGDERAAQKVKRKKAAQIARIVQEKSALTAWEKQAKAKEIARREEERADDLAVAEQAKAELERADQELEEAARTGKQAILDKERKDVDVSRAIKIPEKRKPYYVEVVEEADSIRRGWSSPKLDQEEEERAKALETKAYMESPPTASAEDLISRQSEVSVSGRKRSSDVKIKQRSSLSRTPAQITSDMKLRALSVEQSVEEILAVKIVEQRPSVKDVTSKPKMKKRKPSFPGETGPVYGLEILPVPSEHGPFRIKQYQKEPARPESGKKVLKGTLYEMPMTGTISETGSKLLGPRPQFAKTDPKREAVTPEWSLESSKSYQELKAMKNDAELEVIEADAELTKAIDAGKDLDVIKSYEAVKAYCETKVQKSDADLKTMEAHAEVMKALKAGKDIKTIKSLEANKDILEIKAVKADAEMKAKEAEMELAKAVAARKDQKAIQACQTMKDFYELKTKKAYAELKATEAEVKLTKAMEAGKDLETIKNLQAIKDYHELQVTKSSADLKAMEAEAELANAGKDLKAIKHYRVIKTFHELTSMKADAELKGMEANAELAKTVKPGLDIKALQAMKAFQETKARKADAELKAMKADMEFVKALKAGKDLRAIKNIKAIKTFQELKAMKAILELKAMETGMDLEAMTADRMMTMEVEEGLREEPMDEATPSKPHASPEDMEELPDTYIRPSEFAEIQSAYDRRQFLVTGKYIAGFGKTAELRDLPLQLKLQSQVGWRGPSLPPQDESVSREHPRPLRIDTSEREKEQKVRSLPQGLSIVLNNIAELKRIRSPSLLETPVLLGTRISKSDTERVPTVVPSESPTHLPTRDDQPICPVVPYAQLKEGDIKTLRPAVRVHKRPVPSSSMPRDLRASLESDEHSAVRVHRRPVPSLSMPRDLRTSLESDEQAIMGYQIGVVPPSTPRQVESEEAGAPTQMMQVSGFPAGQEHLKRGVGFVSHTPAKTSTSAPVPQSLAKLQPSAYVKDQPSAYVKDQPSAYVKDQPLPALRSIPTFRAETPEVQLDKDVFVTQIISLKRRTDDTSTRPVTAPVESLRQHFDDTLVRPVTAPVEPVPLAQAIGVSMESKTPQAEFKDRTSTPKMKQSVLLAAAQHRPLSRQKERTPSLELRGFVMKRPGVPTETPEKVEPRPYTQPSPSLTSMGKEAGHFLRPITPVPRLVSKCPYFRRVVGDPMDLDEAAFFTHPTLLRITPSAGYVRHFMSTRDDLRWMKRPGQFATGLPMTPVAGDQPPVLAAVGKQMGPLKTGETGAGKTTQVLKVGETAKRQLHEWKYMKKDPSFLLRAKPPCYYLGSPFHEHRFFLRDKRSIITLDVKEAEMYSYEHMRQRLERVPSGRTRTRWPVVKQPAESMIRNPDMRQHLQEGRQLLQSRQDREVMLEECCGQLVSDILDYQIPGMKGVQNYTGLLGRQNSDAALPSPAH